MEKLLLNRKNKINGTIELPGSKSISNRALLMAALAEGPVTLTNLLESADVNRMFEGLKTLGLDISRNLENRTATLTGCAGPLPNGDFDLYLENAGTAVRSMSAALCLSKGNYRVDGNARMRERPIQHLVDGLLPLGADIKYELNEGFPPLLIKANGLKGGKTSVDGSVSSQYLTALLISAPYAENDVEISIKGDLTSKPYIDMTINLMQKFGVEVVNENFEKFTIKAGQKYVNPQTFFIEGDASSASYFLGAAAINGQSKVIGYGPDSIQGESGFANVMGLMGADVSFGDNSVEVKSTGKLKGIDIDMNNMTDTGMTLAVVAMFAEGKTTIRNIYNWRVKETERIHAVSTELRKVGAHVEEGHDYIIITPPEKLLDAEIETYDDHRMAMAFSLLSLGSSGITILDPKCTSKTFPTYFDVWDSITE
ncbi:MAG: 3-phosphoshikimate 1-carboxyvinyltransferase [Lentisphaeraceae bacterium]|nr:3-phosphoshikimate 1-carboxyvinyltransferase [Lentisphaeraceae bacterium]